MFNVYALNKRSIEVLPANERSLLFWWSLMGCHSNTKWSSDGSGQQAIHMNATHSYCVGGWWVHTTAFSIKTLWPHWEPDPWNTHRYKGALILALRSISYKYITFTWQLQAKRCVQTTWQQNRHQYTVISVLLHEVFPARAKDIIITTPGLPWPSLIHLALQHLQSCHLHLTSLLHILKHGFIHWHHTPSAQYLICQI